MDLLLDPWLGKLVNKFEIQEIISKWIESRSGYKSDVKSDFFESGLIDSLLFAELIVHLEEALNIQMDFSNLADWTKLKSINGLSEFTVDQFEK
jgi:acyl carrier protein